MSNLATVQGMYAAFGRGDIPAILAALSPTIEWEYGYAADAIPLPWFQPRHGHEGAVEFFTVLAENVDISVFDIHTLLEGKDIVVAVFNIEATVKRTGKKVTEHDTVHIWRFDESGQVSAFRHCEDTYQQVMAYQA